MKLHLIGIFHTVCQPEVSHCAFTGKVFRFGKMMQEYGYDVCEYSNASTSECREKVDILTESEVQSLSTRTGSTDFWGDDAKIESPLWKLFDERLRKRLAVRFRPGDFLCFPFGECHKDLPGNRQIETGIGYPNTFSKFRVYESYAWMHYHQGKSGRGGDNYEWVVPNYYDLDDWTPSFTPGEYLLFFGRITPAKGLEVIRELANHVTIPIVICGQGDPARYLHPNIIYVPPVSGSARSTLLANARACLMPTHFTEPFGGSGVEGMLCGTPLITHDFGAFTETVVPGVNGYRCHTLGDWLEAIERVGRLHRNVIATHARNRYSLSACGQRYDRIFNQINDLRKEGWYTKTPRNL